MKEDMYLRLYEEVQTLLLLEPYDITKQSNKYIDEAMHALKFPRNPNFWGHEGYTQLRKYIITNGKDKIDPKLFLIKEN